MEIKEIRSKLESGMNCLNSALEGLEIRESDIAAKELELESLESEVKDRTKIIVEREKKVGDVEAKEIDDFIALKNDSEAKLEVAERAMSDLANKKSAFDNYYSDKMTEIKQAEGNMLSNNAAYESKLTSLAKERAAFDKYMVQKEADLKKKLSGGI